MCYRIKIICVLSALLNSVSAVSAQNPDNFIILAGVSAGFPVGEFADTEGSDAGVATSGLGFTVAGMLKIGEHISVLGELMHVKFGMDEYELEVTDASHGLSQFGLGLRHWIPTSSKLVPYFQWGFGYYRDKTEMSAAGITVSVKSKGSVGVNAGGGVMVSSGRINLDLCLRYHSTKCEFNYAGSRHEQNIAWIGLVTRVSVPF